MPGNTPRSFAQDEELSLGTADILASAPLSRPSHGRAAADPLIGRVIADRYRLIEPIGRGGMGIVYKVAHTRIGKLLAMKLLAGELSQSPEVVRRFKREALTVSRLQSPSTVQVFDFGVADGLSYLVMELVQGESLGRILQREGPISATRVGKIVVQICSSLAEAHAKGIVHRDIKPDNVMIVAGADGSDVAKVLDFGLAKLREAEGLGEVTSHGTVLGTPHYMAPEQIRGESVDARADVYALGALMYRALTGVHIFAGPPMAVLSRHLNEAPIPPHQRAPELNIPVGLSRLVMRALRKRPEDRFSRVEEMRAELVEEMRAAGSSSVDALLDATHLAHLARLGGEARAANSVTQRAPALATRDEVDAYERRLRRTRYGLLGLSALLLGASGLAAVKLLAPAPAVFTGAEREPNDTPAEATPLPLGARVSGQLGKRIDTSLGDRDFYMVDLPAAGGGDHALLSIHLGALPNLPMCVLLYRPGFADALGQYCTGRPGRDLSIPALSLAPGRYFVAVLQDLDGYGAGPTYVHENISDRYTLKVEPGVALPYVEVEPNDQAATATPVPFGRAVTGALGWARDEDMLCAPPSPSGRVRWTVRAGLRESGVLEVTPIVDGNEGAPVRIHAEERGARSGADAVSPWQSAAIASAGPACLRVRLASDPWASDRFGAAPVGSGEPYQVEAEALP
ncbi:MAG: serine/threonine-protein kinase [Byssovorax sp.]